MTTPDIVLKQILFSIVDPLTTGKIEQMKADFPELFSTFFSLVQSASYKKRAKKIAATTVQQLQKMDKPARLDWEREKKNVAKQKQSYHLFAAMTVDSLSAMRSFKNRTTSMGRVIGILNSLAKGNRTNAELQSVLGLAASRKWSRAAERDLFEEYVRLVLPALAKSARGEVAAIYVDNHAIKGRRQAGRSEESGFSCTVTTVLGARALPLGCTEFDDSTTPLAVVFDAARSRELFLSLEKFLVLSNPADVFGTTYPSPASFPIPACIALFPSLRHFMALPQLVGVNFGTQANFNGVIMETFAELFMNSDGIGPKMIMACME